MERLESPALASVLGRLQSCAGIGKEWPVGEGNAELRAGYAQMFHHPRDILRSEEVGEGSSLHRRFRMDLDTAPIQRKFKLLLQLFDDAFADIAEGSDIVREYFDADCHGSPSRAIVSLQSTVPREEAKVKVGRSGVAAALPRREPGTLIRGSRHRGRRIPQGFSMDLSSFLPEKYSYTVLKFTFQVI